MPGPTTAKFVCDQAQMAQSAVRGEVSLWEFLRDTELQHAMAQALRERFGNTRLEAVRVVIATPQPIRMTLALVRMGNKWLLPGLPCPLDALGTLISELASVSAEPPRVAIDLLDNADQLLRPGADLTTRLLHALHPRSQLRRTV